MLINLNFRSSLLFHSSSLHSVILLHHWLFFRLWFHKSILQVDSGRERAFTAHGTVLESDVNTLGHHNHAVHGVASASSYSELVPRLLVTPGIHDVHHGSLYCFPLELDGVTFG